MKLHRLELTGFGPFHETQVVDFDAFDDDGVFLISGRTGTGKSSILDGVSFALYGSVPRYDGGERRLRSDHSFIGDPTEVRLEFTVGDTRWRVTRAPEYERPAKRGGGVTLEPTRAELEEWVAETWVGRAAKPRDVALLLDDVLGLNAQQFQQVILLAQNKFSRFLLARNDERQALLRTLFGTRRFEQYKADLDERRRDAQKRLDARGENARTILDLAERLVDEHDLAGDDERPDDIPGRRTCVTKAVQRAGYRVEQSTTQRHLAATAATAAAAAHTAIVASAQAFGELARARGELTRLEGDAPRIVEARAALDRARAAEVLRAPIEAAEHESAAVARARQASERARTDWLAADGSEDDELAAIVDELSGLLGRLAAAIEQERELTEIEAALPAQEHELAAVETRLAAVDEQIGLLPAELARIEGESRSASDEAARLDDARTAAATVGKQREAARESAVRESAAVAAEAEYARRSAAATAANETVTGLLQQRLAGFAGELAGRLVDEEPCAVCGSTTHPRPARPADDPVTDERLADAEMARDEAAAAVLAAGSEARAARAAHAETSAQAGGLSVAELDEQLVTASAAVGRAEAAEARVAVLADERRRLEARQAELLEEREDLARQQQTARELRVSAVTRVDALTIAVSSARGDFASVGDRVAAAHGRRDLARAALEAQAGLAEAERARGRAHADRDSRLAESVFSSVADAVAALLPLAMQSEIESLVSEHAGALTATKARLLDLELARADETPPSDEDVMRAERAAVDADGARTAAIAAQRDAENAASSLRALLADADSAFADVEAVADEAAVITRLADTVAGRAPNTMKMELETFVLAAELEDIVTSANLRLSEMSNGRYALLHTDARQARNAASGLGIEVFDGFTGQARSPQSLSGGETFLASLALALGLAEVVTAQTSGIRLDTLFIDEGFGSLDAETLELAMETLDELRHGGRTVGVISHVDSMKDRIASRIIVEATPQGSSTIRQDVGFIA